MPVEMGLWRIDGAAPRRLGTSVLPSEASLEDYLERDPSLLGERLLIIGRQVPTAYGKFIDLLAMDSEGNLHILELKRDRTPRDVVAQLLDYGSWVSALDRETVLELANDHLSVPFETAFVETFGGSPPDELNAELELTIVATDLDASSERIVTYLRAFGVPINAVFFAYLEDESRRYLARSWFIPPDDGGGTSSARGRTSKRADWNGLDWFVSFGDDDLGRSWEDGRRYGFVSAGGDPWYSRTLRGLPVGARVNVHIPKLGYVAVGETLAEAERFDSTNVLVDGQWVRLADQELAGRYRHGHADEAVTDDNAEYAVPVRWLVATPKSEAYWEKGMFANQNSACKLRQEFTLERLAHHFQLDEH
ncbi:endonuclease NucS domain-containing protein [Georgenia sp. H159]|uniref:endonuclease NucS domain-containing protein n=1 Tax=Georgenia sp. H159 TaxID=3076115 RepID=UPI002D76BEE8|nr:endonuclease NucS domain-containing protein [Georgenia sp. H159]